MQEVTMIIGDLTLFSLIEILFLQQDYRTINFLIEGDGNDLSNEMMQRASDSLIPFTHFVVGELNTGRSRSEAPILNVVAPNYLNNGTSVDVVRDNIFPDDVTIVMPSESYGEIEDSNIGMWMNLSAMVILLTPNLTMFYSTFENVSTSKIDLSPFDPSSLRAVVKNVFAPEYVSRQERNFSIFFQFFPPRTVVGPRGQDFFVMGPDGTLAETLVKWLKVNPTFSSNIAESYPDYEKWKDASPVTSRIHWQYFYPKVLTTNLLKIFNKSITEGIDLQLSPYSVYEENIQMKTENLYPHEKDCLVIFVPKRSKLDNFLQNITSNPDIQSIFIALIIFAIVRIIVQRTPFKQWIFIFLKTLGIFLNQDGMKNRNSLEVAWDINLRVFSVLATVTLSVIIFENVMSEEYSEIDTIDDLVASNLTILAPDFLLNDESVMSAIKSQLHDKITFKPVMDQNADLVERRMFKNAYVYTDGLAEYTDMLLHSYISNAKSYKRTIRIMKEKLYCRLSAYRISTMSPLKEYVNDFIRRFIENGLYDKHLQWMRRLNRHIFQVNKYRSTRKDAKDPVVLNIELVFGILVLYMAGVTISFAVFLLEMKI